MSSKAWDIICLTLIIIGALNWGLVGSFHFDLVSAVFGAGLSWIARIIFAVVGLAGIYGLFMYGRLKRRTE